MLKCEIEDTVFFKDKCSNLIDHETLLYITQIAPISTSYLLNYFEI